VATHHQFHQLDQVRLLVTYHHQAQGQYSQITFEYRTSIDMEKISRTSYEKFFRLIVSPYSLWDSCLPEKKKELYGYIFQEDFFIGREYKCRTPAPSPLYQYLKDFSLVCEENKQDVPDLWRWADSNRRVQKG